MRDVRVIRVGYGAIVTCIDNIHENSHDPEALGLSKALGKQSTVAAIYMLDYVLPQVAKLSRTWQTEHLELFVISCLVEATLHTLNDTSLLAANWVLDLRDESNNLEEAAGIKVTLADITAFKEKVAKSLLLT